MPVLRALWLKGLVPLSFSIGSRSKEVQTRTLEPNSIPLPVQLAAEIGIAESVVLQQIHYWLTKECGRIVDGVRWIYNSYQEWQAQMPFLGLSAIRRAIAFLEREKLIKSERFDEKRWNQTKFYTIDYERLKALQLSICQNETPRSATTLHLDLPVLNGSYTETTSKTFPETTNSPAAVFPEAELTPEEIRAAIASIAESIQPESPREEPQLVGRDNSSAAAAEHQILDEVRAVVPLNLSLQRLVLESSIEVVKDALAALVETTKRGKKVRNPVGWLVDAIKGGWKPVVVATPQVVTKQYPSPTLEQLNELGAIGRLVHTVLDEPGNPQVLAVDTGTGVVPWWQALKRHAPPDTSQTALGQI